MVIDTLSATFIKMRFKTGYSGVMNSGIKFYAVIKGDFWISVDGEKKQYHLQTGDCCL